VNPTPEPIHALTGAYILHALDADDQALFEAHLDVCDGCAREVEQLRRVTTRMSEASAQVPPDGLRERLLEAAAATPQEPTTTRPATSTPRRRAGAGWPGRLAAAAAVLLTFAVAGLGYLVADLSERLERSEVIAGQAARSSQQLVQLLTAPDAELVTGAGEGDATGRALVSRDLGEAALVTTGLDPAPPGQTYQVWLIDDQVGATSAGLLEVDADGSGTEGLSGELAGTVAIGVTIEPAGGSPQPTSEPLLAIELG
jgi:anti-sigma-K factor RskA